MDHRLSIDKATGIIIYGLTPGSHSRLHDLEICLDRCEGGENLVYSGSIIIFVPMTTLILNLLYL